MKVLQTPTGVHPLLLARQAGTAHAFLPLIRRLRAEGTPFSLLALSHAARIWREADLAAREASHYQEALPWLANQHSVSHLISGTSEVAQDDARFWHWAAERALPTLAWVDTWEGYRKRFSSPGSSFDLLPTTLGVIDERARRGMLREGAPPSLLRRVGHPGLESLATLPPRLPSQAGTSRILFVSEPLSRKQGSAEDPGYTEQEVLLLLLDALGELAPEGGWQGELVLRPHPREEEEEWRSWLARLPPLPLSLRLSHGDRHQLCREASLVVGMRSILLVEASLLGCPVLSLQPGRRHPCDITDDRAGLTVVTRTAEIPAALQRLLTESSPIPPPSRQALPPGEGFLRWLGEESGSSGRPSPPSAAQWAPAG